MCEVTPYMVSIATKRGISVIYHFHTSDQRKASAYRSHIGSVGSNALRNIITFVVTK